MTPFLDADIQEIYDRLKPHRHLIDGKSFLICGSDGFLGRYAQAVLSEFENVHIYALDKDKPRLEIPGVIYLVADIIDFTAETAYEYLDVPIDYIWAGASIASPKVYKHFPIECLDVGYIGLKNCLEIAQDRKSKLLFFSSSEVYGTATQIPTPETYIGAIQTNGERSCYDISKLVGESLTHYYVEQRNVQATTVLPFNFYGPQNQDGRVLPSFMAQLVNQKPLEVFDGGERKRCYTYITDGLTGVFLALLLGKAGSKYNVGNPNDELTVSQLADRVIAISNLPAEKKLISYPENYAGGSDPLRRMPDIQKARTELGFEPQVSLDDGIARFYSWAKENYLGK